MRRNTHGFLHGHAPASAVANPSSSLVSKTKMAVLFSKDAIGPSPFYVLL